MRSLGLIGDTRKTKINKKYYKDLVGRGIVLDERLARRDLDECTLVLIRWRAAIKLVTQTKCRAHNTLFCICYYAFELMELSLSRFQCVYLNVLHNIILLINGCG